jgi:hypothetical protein
MSRYRRPARRQPASLNRDVAHEVERQRRGMVPGIVAEQGAPIFAGGTDELSDADRLRMWQFERRDVQMQPGMTPEQYTMARHPYRAAAYQVGHPNEEDQVAEAERLAKMAARREGRPFAPAERVTALRSAWQALGQRVQTGASTSTTGQEGGVSGG